MEEEKGPARVPPGAAATPQPPNSGKESEAGGGRQRFEVELRPGETTIVSWKKLLKESGRGGAPTVVVAVADPAAPDQPAHGEPNDALPPSRFSAVIEKIERLYVGKQSSDEEELDDVPDDDQYDTDDSFIDDAELDEYFQVDKLETKHSGFFVNRGKLEQIEPSSSPNVEPKRRRRKDTSRDYSEEKDHENILMDPVKMGNARIKTAARKAPLIGKKLSKPSKVLTYADHYQEGKLCKRKANPLAAYRRKALDIYMNSDNPQPVEAPNKNALLLPSEIKDIDKQNSGVITSRNLVHKGRSTSDSYDATSQIPRDKAVSSQAAPQSNRLPSGESGVEVSNKVRSKERNGIIRFPETNSSGNIYSVKSSHLSSTRLKESSAVRPKGTTLERAIRDLEKIVDECRPPHLDVHEADNSSQVIKRRLPQEVKTKLAKVARLSANQCKISEDDILDRLMGILGHLVQRKTLKKNMKEMVELGLSAKQEKADRFQQIKKDVNDMIRARVSHFNPKVVGHQDGSADDFQEAPSNDQQRALIGKYSMDKALEDKICDLYDLYVEGMDEDKGPQSRKLYVELAELWPSGYMDNHGIKEAIYRSKERKRALYNRRKVREEERIKRKRLASAMRLEEGNQNVAVRIGQEKHTIDTSGQVFISPDRVNSNQLLGSSSKMSATSPMNDYGHHYGLNHYEKGRGRTDMVTEDGRIIKKRMKGRPESDLGEVHGHQLKLPFHDTNDKSKSQKQGETNVVHQQKLSLQLSGAQITGQPS